MIRDEVSLDNDGVAGLDLIRDIIRTFGCSHIVDFNDTR
jgi:hypothetical protein